MKLKKHEYNDLPSCIVAMLAGVVFHYDDRQIFFRDQGEDVRALGFRLTHKSFPDDYLKGYWKSWEDWQVVVNWWDDLPEEKVLCWVTDAQGNPLSCPKVIKGRIQSAFSVLNSTEPTYRYVDILGLSYFNAEPVTNRDLWSGLS